MLLKENIDSKIVMKTYPIKYNCYTKCFYYIFFFIKPQSHTSGDLDSPITDTNTCQQTVVKLVVSYNSF